MLPFLATNILTWVQGENVLKSKQPVRMDWSQAVLTNTDGVVMPAYYYGMTGFHREGDLAETGTAQCG